MLDAGLADEAIAVAEAAIAPGAWTDAYASLLDADRRHRFAEPKAITLLAQSAYLSGSMDAATQALERLHASALAAGDREAAAAAAGQMAFMLYDAVMYARSRAGIRRAERLLADLPDSPVWAHTLMLGGWHALTEGDYDKTIDVERQSAARAEKAGDGDTVAIARVAEGRAPLARGDIEEGLAILDESSVAAVSGELGPVATGVVYCMANCAYQSVSDFERAEEWTRAMETWSATAGLTSFQGRCRVHRAQLKRLHGDWRSAAAEAAKAGEELGSVVPAERGWAITELGLIRLRLGDLAGAEAAFLEAHEAGWEPPPGLALLRLAQGSVAAAVEGIRDALDHAEEIASREVPPHGALRRAPLLAAQAEVAIAAGDLATARADAQELESVAATYRTRALLAIASGVRGSVRLEEGDAAGAARAFQARDRHAAPRMAATVVGPARHTCC